MDYLKIFIDYCKANSIYFAVDGNGGLDEVTFTNYNYDSHYAPAIQFGSKEACEWVVEEYQRVVKENEV